MLSNQDGCGDSLSDCSGQSRTDDSERMSWVQISQGEVETDGDREGKGPAQCSNCNAESIEAPYAVNDALREEVEHQEGSDIVGRKLIPVCFEWVRVLRAHD